MLLKKRPLLCISVRPYSAFLRFGMEKYMLFYVYAFAMPLHHLNSFFVPYIFTPSIDPLPLLSSISYSSGNSPLNHPLSPPPPLAALYPI